MRRLGCVIHHAQHQNIQSHPGDRARRRFSKALLDKALLDKALLDKALLDKALLSEANTAELPTSFRREKVAVTRTDVSL
jgi:uncharacterized protein YjbI with pentapeptide repeats